MTSRARLSLSILLVLVGSNATVVRNPSLFAAAVQLPSASASQFVVVFNGSAAPRATEAATLRSYGITQGVLLQSLPIAGVLATEAQVAALAAHPSVRSVTPNRAIAFENEGATAATGVDRARADERFVKRNGGYTIAGRGVTIVTNDSGTDGAHPDLREHIVQNVAGQLNLADVITGAPVTYQEGVSNTDAGGGHGTHVGGIAVGTGAASNGRFEGVAPQANLVGFGSGAAALLLNVLGGFDYALTNRDRYGIRVVNNSWGDTGDVCTDFNPDDPINVATKALTDAGVVVVFSAGNSGPGECTITGNFKKAPWVITVANASKSRVLSNSSSRGSRTRPGDRPTVTAPGSFIVSARAVGSTTPALSPASTVNDALGIPPENLLHYTTLSGTSMAAPHVAGIVAMMLDANPALTPAQVKAIIEETADMMAGYEPWQVGAGFVNAYDAVAASFDGRLRTDKCTNQKHCPARVVVSIIDSAINPYHAFFNAGGEIYSAQAPSSVTPELLAAFGIDEAHIITLTRTGNFAADYAADKAIWDNIRPRELYWFRGTNILAISFDPGTRPILPDASGDTHGVGTSAAMLRANPEAILLFVEGITQDAESYAFTHPQVDIISNSYGWPGSLPLPWWDNLWHLEDSYVGVVEKGKLHFGAADNTPAIQFPDASAGPWWSIGVAGYQEGTTEGDQILSGSFPDFVGDFTQTLPYCFDCESGMRTVSGTSFATPRSAGTMSRILLEARRSIGHVGGIRSVDGTPYIAVGNGHALTNWQLRRALEEAAHYPSLADYEPVVGTGNDSRSLPVFDPAPWLTVAWGAITPDPSRGVVEQTLAHLGIRGTATRHKDALACEYMRPQITVRHAYWDRVIFAGSESGGTVRDPYIYCWP